MSLQRDKGARDVESGQVSSPPANPQRPTRTRKLMATGTAQQMQRRGSRQHHGPAAVELVNALMNQPLVREFSQTRRKPSTLSALERRWFVGRLRLATARDKHNSLSQAELSDPLLGCNLELIGTAGLLCMALPADSNNLVTVRASARADWYEFLLRVPVRKRGKLPGFKYAVMGDRARGRHSVIMGTKKYYVHAEVVAAARRYIEAFEEQTRSSTDSRSVGLHTSAELALASAVFGHGHGIACKPLDTTDTRRLDQPANIFAGDFMHILDADEPDVMSSPGETYADPEVAATEDFTASEGATFVPALQELAANFHPIPLGDDLQWKGGDGGVCELKVARAVLVPAVYAETQMIT